MINLLLLTLAPRPSIKDNLASLVELGCRVSILAREDGNEGCLLTITLPGEVPISAIRGSISEAFTAALGLAVECMGDC